MNNIKSYFSFQNESNLEGEEISKDEKEKSILAEKYKFMYDEIKDDDIDYNKKRKKQKNKFGKRHNPKHMK